MKTYIEEFLMTFSGFHQMVFSFLIAYSLQQLFPQLTAHSNFFHSHSPTKHTHSSFTLCKVAHLYPQVMLPICQGIATPMHLYQGRKAG
jgi:hypothetical protein